MLKNQKIFWNIKSIINIYIIIFRWEPDICRWSKPYKDVDDYFDNDNCEEIITDISTKYVDTYLKLLESIMNDEPYTNSEDLCLFSLYGGIDLLNISLLFFF